MLNFILQQPTSMINDMRMGWMARRLNDIHLSIPYLRADSKLNWYYSKGRAIDCFPFSSDIWIMQTPTNMAASKVFLNY